MTMKQITDALESIGPMTSLELRAHIGLTRATTDDQIGRLLKRKMIHISSWQRQPSGQRGAISPVFGLGDFADAERLPRKPQAQRSAEYNVRHRVIIAARRSPVRKQAAGVWAGLGAKPHRVNISA